MPSNHHFSYIIVGNGLAGLQLALELSKDPFFCDKQIALIDPSEKTTNDKTWCFWEQRASKWDHIVSQSWDMASFQSSNKSMDLDLAPYSYKMIRSIDFYEYAKETLSLNKNVFFIKDEVTNIEESDTVNVTTKKSRYTCNRVFDSRLPKAYFNKKNDHIIINQHFKGWIIECETSAFNPDKFTMMDYRLKDGAQTTFFYVLPFSKNKALVEFTYFTPHLVDDSRYDMFLKTYIEDLLKIKTYTIQAIETGNIPMTNFKFKNESTKQITKIGTGGGWVKGSTGYSFKHTEKKVAKIIENIKQNNRPSTGLFNQRHAFYDSVFLRVLKDHNEKGEWIFEQIYLKNRVDILFRFLDEASSLKDEFNMMQSLFSRTFIKAFFKTLLF